MQMMLLERLRFALRRPAPGAEGDTSIRPLAFFVCELKELLEVNHTLG
jgi:hypothetical protein